MVQLDSCILLNQPCEENGNQDTVPQSCSISLQLESPFPSAIASLVVVSEVSFFL